MAAGQTLMMVRSSLEGAKVGKLSSRAQLEFAKIVARFSLYYFGAEKVAQILSNFPSNLDYGANILDFFLTEMRGSPTKGGGHLSVRIALKGDGGCFRGPPPFPAEEFWCKRH